MSATLFSSKSQKSVRNYRKLLISSPLHVSPPTALLPTFSLNRTPGWTVVLRAKYSFEALCKPELSLHRGDHVRLLERPGNGWLKVQRIHEIGEGLVPALYLEITVNDPENPVSLEWLNDYQAPSSMRNRVAHVKVRCAYLSNSNNFWYRMDVTFNSQRQAYCAMFYEDFVSLHALYGSTALAGVFQIELPKNTPAVSPRLQNTMRSEAAARAQTPMVASLDKFVQSLLRFAQCHSSNFLGDYIDNHCTRKVHVRSGETVPSDEVIASSLVDGSIKISLDGRFARNNSFSPTAPLPPVQGEPIGRADTLTYAPNAPYLASNMKYLSYLNQSEKPLIRKALLKLPKPGGRNTTRKSVISLNSVIESYDFPSSDGLENEEEQERDEEKERSINETDHRVDFRNVFDVHQAQLSSLLAQKMLTGSSFADKSKGLFDANSKSLRTPHLTFISEYSSECNLSYITASTDSNEPRTPTFGNLLVHPLVNVLSEENLNPLEKRKHYMHPASADVLPSSIAKYPWDSLLHS